MSSPEDFPAEAASSVLGDYSRTAAGVAGAVFWGRHSMNDYRDTLVDVLRVARDLAGGHTELDRANCKILAHYAITLLEIVNPDALAGEN